MKGPRRARGGAAGGLAGLAIVVLDLVALSGLILYADLRAASLPPPSRRASQPGRPKPTDVTARFGPDGLSLAGHRVTQSQFETRLRKLLELDPDQGVVLVVRAGAPPAGLRAVVAACRAAGVRRIILDRRTGEP